MNHRPRARVCLLCCVALLPAYASAGAPTSQPVVSDQKMDGYYGIWFTLGQYQSAYGDKYSGGLGTYTANHNPIAIYSRQANKTFFSYGGTIPGERHLLIMASYYDHAKGVVPKPTIVHDKQGVNDPHDNGAICLDDRGYLWVFVSGRARKRPGFKYRSTEPFSTERFVRISEEEMTYPQPWFVPGKGFFHLFTKYTGGRELYWETSKDGVTWSEDHKLVGFKGHYQVSQRQGDRIATAFMYHPGGSVDRRTNLYFLQTRDGGATWTTIEDKPVAVPLSKPINPALVREYEAEKKLVYINDLTFDAKGRPVIFYVVSGGAEPGPANDPRVYTLAHWTGAKWEFRDITRCDHNYDLGSLYIEPDGTWRVIGPSAPGPQPYGTGGEVVAWASRDEGRTWAKAADITQASKFNHSYVRRPVDAHPDFYALWADGDAFKFSESHLYFCNQSGDQVRRLPQRMTEPFVKPELIQGK